MNVEVPTQVPEAQASEAPRAQPVPAWAVFVAALLVAATVIHLGFSADALAWAVVQVVLVGVTVYDFANRRIKNAVTVPVAVVAVLLRVAFERSSLAEVVVAGVVTFVAFFALALVLRGGLGMGDVKLGAMLGFLLGFSVLPALFVGAIAGGVGAAVVLSRSTGKRATMAYGPYLALGGSLAIIFSSPPHLI
jgi:leader peptidase (prepilin peptidase)/N-methyltransferase